MKSSLAIVAGSFVMLSCAGSPAPDALARCPGEQRTHADLEGTDASVGDAARGAALFASECSKCHSRRVVERSSRLFRGYPRLDCAPYQAGVTDGYLQRVISQGGEAVGLDSAMKPFAGQLSDKSISDLVAYLRSLAR